MKPYQESVDQSVRVFNENLTTVECEWHFDLEDRIVKIISAGNWEYQEDNKLPEKLSDGQILYIKKNSWHRVIPGNQKLIIKIKRIE